MPDTLYQGTSGGLLSLPHEVLDTIVREYLDYKDVLTLSATCKALRLFAAQESIWRDKLLEQQGEGDLLQYKGSWFGSFASHIQQQALGSPSHTAAAPTTTPSPVQQHFPEPTAHSTLENGVERSTPQHYQKQQPSGNTHDGSLAEKAGVGTRDATEKLPTAAQKVMPPVTQFHSDFLYRRWYRENVELAGFLPVEEHVPRVRAGDGELDMSAPVVIEGMADEWPARQWRWSSLQEQYGDNAMVVQFMVASTRADRKRDRRMTITNFVEYSRGQQDETPAYVFDALFGATCPRMLTEYTVPEPFARDYMEAFGAGQPPFRWLLIGPMRSGSAWHVDPYMTSAWNTLLIGEKRWALYPPGVTPPGLASDPMLTSPPALLWFLDVLPHLAPHQRPLEVVQKPGDTIHVPHGWWHCVLNLTDTVAVTHNRVDRHNFAAAAAYFGYGGKLPDEVAGIVEAERGREGGAAAGYLPGTRQDDKGGLGYSAVGGMASGQLPDSSPARVHDGAGLGYSAVGEAASEQLPESSPAGAYDGVGVGFSTGEGPPAWTVEQVPADVEAELAALVADLEAQEHVPEHARVTGEQLAQVMGVRQQLEAAVQLLKQLKEAVLRIEESVDLTVGEALLLAASGKLRQGARMWRHFARSGFLASKKLSKFLRKSAELDPAIRPEVAHVAQCYFHQHVWLALLCVVEAAWKVDGAAGPPLLRAPAEVSPEGLLPHRGNTAVVAVAGDYVAKFYVASDPGVARTQASAEAWILARVAQHCGVSSGHTTETMTSAGGDASQLRGVVSTPRNLHCGRLSSVTRGTDVAFSNPPCSRWLAPSTVEPLLHLTGGLLDSFLLTSRCTGTLLAELPTAQRHAAMPRVAEALSGYLACVHGLPLPEQALVDTWEHESRLAEVAQDTQTVGTDAAYALGKQLGIFGGPATTVGVHGPHLQANDQHPHVAISSGGSDGQGLADTSGSLGAAAPAHVEGGFWCTGVYSRTWFTTWSPSPEKSNVHMWRPFLDFLQTCTEKTPARYRDSPARLWAAQIGAYLPENLERLLPIEPGGVNPEFEGAVRFSRPCVLHGDVTADNVLVDVQEGDSHLGMTSPRLSVLDFADCGVGDPLYEFVAVGLSALEAREEDLRKLLRGYFAGVGTRSWARRRVAMSHVATCYTLLHPELALLRVLDCRPELRGVATVGELGLKLWGFLDDVEAHVADSPV